VGSAPQLGEWRPIDGAAMEWTDGNVWSVTLDLPSGRDFEFKIAVVSENGLSSIWEGGPNRIITIPSAGKICEGAGFLVDCQWGNPSSTSLAPEGPESVPTDSDGDGRARPGARGHIDCVT